MFKEMQMFLHNPTTKLLQKCAECHNPVYQVEGYRFYNSKVIHDSCFNTYVVRLRRESREKSEVVIYQD